MVERLPCKQEVIGSIPIGSIFSSLGLDVLGEWWRRRKPSQGPSPYRLGPFSPFRVTLPSTLEPS